MYFLATTIICSLSALKSFSCIKHPLVVLVIFYFISDIFAYRVMPYNIYVCTITLIYIVYVIESAAYGVICTSCLCQKPERARYERVRAFDINECI